LLACQLQSFLGLIKSLIELGGGQGEIRRVAPEEQQQY
jgi:hypothetical protein